MGNKRTWLTEQDIIGRVRLPLLPGDIVTDNYMFPKSKHNEHFKILSMYQLEIPYKDAGKPPALETWANVEIIRSPKTPAAVGIKMSEPLGSLRRVEDLTFADYLK